LNRQVAKDARQSGLLDAQLNDNRNRFMIASRGGEALSVNGFTWRFSRFGGSIPAGKV
jgi:hypothetical protein